MTDHARLERPILGDDGQLTAASQKLIAEKGWTGIGHNDRPIPRKWHNNAGSSGSTGRADEQERSALPVTKPKL